MWVQDFWTTLWYMKMDYIWFHQFTFCHYEGCYIFGFLFFTARRAEKVQTWKHKAWRFDLSMIQKKKIVKRCIYMNHNLKNYETVEGHGLGDWVIFPCFLIWSDFKATQCRWPRNQLFSFRYIKKDNFSSQNISTW